MKKHQIIISLLLLVVVGIFIVPRVRSRGEIVLPIELSQQGFPVVAIEIQGHSIPVIFDNGASRTSIALSQEIVKKLELKLLPTNEKACFHDDTGKETCLKVYTIPELKIGHKTLRNVPCQLMDKLWGGHYDEGFIWFEAAKNGVLGLDFLRQFNVLVDYPSSRAILIPLGAYPHQYNVKNWIRMPVSTDGIIVANINGVTTKLVWDTGANHSIMKSTAKVLTEGKIATIKGDPPYQSFETTTFTVCDQPFPKTEFFIQKSEFPFDGLIGSSFFKEHPVFFDFKNNVMWVKP